MSFQRVILVVKLKFTFFVFILKLILRGKILARKILGFLYLNGKHFFRASLTSYFVQYIVLDIGKPDQSEMLNYLVCFSYVSHFYFFTSMYTNSVMTYFEKVRLLFLKIVK
jgi:hypothetical protein